MQHCFANLIPDTCQNPPTLTIKFLSYYTCLCLFWYYVPSSAFFIIYLLLVDLSLFLMYLLLSAVGISPANSCKRTVIAFYHLKWSDLHIFMFSSSSCSSVIFLFSVIFLTSAINFVKTENWTTYMFWMLNLILERVCLAWLVLPFTKIEIK